MVFFWGTPKKMTNSEEVQERRETLYLSPHLANLTQGSCQGVGWHPSPQVRGSEDGHWRGVSELAWGLTRDLALQDGLIPTSSPEAPAHPESGCLRTRVRLRGLSWFGLYTCHTHFQGQKPRLGCAKRPGRARVVTGRCELHMACLIHAEARSEGTD